MFQEIYIWFLFVPLKTEPIGGSKPQLSEDSNLKRIARNREDSMALICPAQGHPIPAFRLSFLKYIFGIGFSLASLFYKKYS